MMHRISMGMQCGQKNNKVMHGYTWQVLIKQLLMYIRETKIFQPWDTKLSFQRYYKTVVVFICWHHAVKEKKLLIEHRLEVCVLHMIIQIHTHNQY